jgi:hypothetical protein
MNEIEPRFEFRAWARNFGMAETRMRRLSPCQGIRESDEIYIVSAASDGSNTKIRDAQLDIKVLVRECDGLEQWEPRMKGAFPMTAETLAKQVFPALGVAPLALDRAEYTLDQCLGEVIRPNRELVAVTVFKRRFAFTVNGCIAEHAEIWINGAGLQTMAAESTEVPAVLEAKRLLGLDDDENVNYLRAIKRVIGMEPAPASY